MLLPVPQLPGACGARISAKQLYKLGTVKGWDRAVSFWVDVCMYSQIMSMQPQISVLASSGRSGNDPPASIVTSANLTYTSGMYAYVDFFLNRERHQEYKYFLSEIFRGNL